MPFTEWVNSTSALATGVTVLAGSFVTVFRFAQKGFAAVVNVGTRLDDMTVKIDQVVKEVTTNGGGSIKDAVLRLEEAQNKTQSATTRIEATQTAAMQLTGKAFWRSNPEGACTFASVNLSRLTGATPEQMQGAGWVSYVKKEDRASVKTEWDNAVKDQREFHMKYAYVHSDGQLVHVVGHAVPVLDDTTKTLVGMIGWAELDTTKE